MNLSVVESEWIPDLILHSEMDWQHLEHQLCVRSGSAAVGGVSTVTLSSGGVSARADVFDLVAQGGVDAAVANCFRSLSFEVFSTHLHP